MLPIKDNVPTRHFPAVTVALIVANVLVYFLYQDGGLSAPISPARDAALSPTERAAFHPCEVDDSCRVVGYDWPATLFTSMFMHADILHLGGNMLFLWIFGNNVEDTMGRLRYIVFYLLAGLAATALQTFVTLETGSAQAATIPNLGASGAISGVLGGYLLILPHARILTAVLIVFFYTLIELPAILYLGIYFLFQAWQAGFQLLEPPETGGVAVFAHIGGFVFGAATVYLFRKRAPLRPRY